MRSVMSVFGLDTCISTIISGLVSLTSPTEKSRNEGGGVTLRDGRVGERLDFCFV